MTDRDEKERSEKKELRKCEKRCVKVSRYNRVKRSVQQGGPESGKRVYTAKIEVKFNYANNRVQECLETKA